MAIAMLRGLNPGIARDFCCSSHFGCAKILFIGLFISSDKFMAPSYSVR